MNVRIVYDSKSLKAVMVASSLKTASVWPGKDSEGYCWCNGAKFLAEDLRAFDFCTTQEAADQIHALQKYLFIREQDGKPVGIRPPTLQEKALVDSQLYRAERLASMARLLSERRELEDLVSVGMDSDGSIAKKLEVLNAQINAQKETESYC